MAESTQEELNEAFFAALKQPVPHGVLDAVNAYTKAKMERGAYVSKWVRKFFAVLNSNDPAETAQRILEAEERGPDSEA